MSGLDDLVAEAMNRKLITTPLRDTRDVLGETPSLNESAPEPTTPTIDEQEMPGVLSHAVTWKDTPEPKVNSKGGIAPDASLAFTVNGVRCIVTIHVEPGATVTTPTTPKAKAPPKGVKVKGIRGATSEEVEAPEASEEGFDKTKPISDDNLPSGWVYDPVVGATPAPPQSVWLCPEHAKAEDRKSNITGRDFTVCPECGRLAPK